MAVTYVSEFTFPKGFGFTGSAGVQHVKGYARGGKVAREERAEHKADGGHWMKAAVKHPGAFKAKAEHAHMSTSAYAAKVTKPGSKASPQTKRQAGLAKTFAKLRPHAKGGAVHSDEAADKALIKRMVKSEDLKKAKGGCVTKAGGGLNRAPGKKRMAAIHAAERQRTRAPSVAPRKTRSPQIPGLASLAPPMGAMAAPMGGPPPGVPMGGAPGAGMRRGGRSKK